MGVLSDLVVVPASDLPRVLASVNPATQFGGVDVKGLDTVKLYKLHMQLTGVSYDDAMAAFQTTCDSDEGPWVTPLPDALVKRLATLDEERGDAVAGRWSRAEEFALDGWDRSDVAAVLECLCTLARKARGKGHLVVLWMSL